MIDNEVGDLAQGVGKGRGSVVPREECGGMLLANDTVPFRGLLTVRRQADIYELS